MTRDEAIKRATMVAVRAILDNDFEDKLGRSVGVTAIIDSFAVVEMYETLERWTLEYEGWSPAELAKRVDPATIERLRRSRAVLAKARGETA